MNDATGRETRYQPITAKDLSFGPQLKIPVRCDVCNITKYEMPDELMKNGWTLTKHIVRCPVHRRSL